MLVVVPLANECAGTVIDSVRDARCDLELVHR